MFLFNFINISSLIINIFYHILLLITFLPFKLFKNRYLHLKMTSKRPKCRDFLHHAIQLEGEMEIRERGKKIMVKKATVKLSNILNVLSLTYHSFA